MFLGSVKAILQVSKQKRRLHIREARKRSEKMDKFLLYIKLFVGMGFIWTFEILSGLLPHSSSHVWWVTDTLNMCQGLYVFLIFACKRNVSAIALAPNTPQGRMWSYVSKNTKWTTATTANNSAPATSQNQPGPSQGTQDVQLSEYRDN